MHMSYKVYLLKSFRPNYVKFSSTPFSDNIHWKISPPCARLNSQLGYNLALIYQRIFKGSNTCGWRFTELQYNGDVRTFLGNVVLWWQFWALEYSVWSGYNFLQCSIMMVGYRRSASIGGTHWTISILRHACTGRNK